MKRYYSLLISLFCMCFFVTSCIDDDEINYGTIKHNDISCTIKADGNKLIIMMSNENNSSDIASSLILDNQELFTTNSHPYIYETNVNKGPHKVGFKTSNSFSVGFDGKAILSGEVSSSTTITIYIN